MCYGRDRRRQSLRLRRTASAASGIDRTAPAERLALVPLTASSVRLVPGATVRAHVVEEAGLPLLPTPNSEEAKQRGAATGVAAAAREAPEVVLIRERALRKTIEWIHRIRLIVALRCHRTALIQHIGSDRRLTENPQGGRMPTPLVSDLQSNLYTLWNRMSSGSYFSSAGPKSSYTRVLLNPSRTQGIGDHLT